MRIPVRTRFREHGRGTQLVQSIEDYTFGREETATVKHGITRLDGLSISLLKRLLL